ncbi:hypothetical protein DENSPDRAFT_831461 [Dentipellis sp. KUC8613]|nr:hypothetical protein DENSPDRAFT_831461 [Dentipellis sp. KUC8613]
MEDSENPNPPSTLASTETPPSSEPSPAPAPTAAPVQAPATSERTELLARARSFLQSPQVRNEDLASKQRFLAEKGLSDAEVNQLLHELPPQLPSIPPRTYPQPPPSNLPNLLAGIFRVFTWITGGSLVALAIYYRFILPRLVKTASARHSIRSHQSDLLSKLTTSLQGLKETQAETFSVLPAPSPMREAVEYAKCQTLDDILSTSKESHDVPALSVLRCALADSAAQDQQPTTEELFNVLYAKFPWIESDTDYQDNLWATLTTHTVFSKNEDEESGLVRWSFVPPPEPETPPLISSLRSLKGSFPTELDDSNTRFQHTLQTLIDFTGYLTTQTYQLSSSAFRASGFGSTALGPEEENIRREIRALKGLVLNRRTFMSPRPTTPTATVTP